MLDLACAVGLVALSVVVALAYAGRVSRAGAAHHARIDQAGSSPLLGKDAMEMGYWALRPIARACLALGVSANAVSWASLAFAAIAGLALAGGHFGLGAAASVVSAACDAIDGLVARESGTAGDSGEVLDAAIDRYAELLFLGGIAFFERLDGPMLLLTLAAAAGAMMVSYSTAKAEALKVKPPRGAMRRQERAVYLALGTALVPIASSIAARWNLPTWVALSPLTACLALVAVVGNVSAVRRLRAVAYAVRRPAPLVSRPADAANAIAGEAHAAGNTTH